MPDFRRYDYQISDGSTTLDLIAYNKAQATTNSLPLRPVRQDTGANPNEVRPESGDIFSQGDFSGGAGQRLFHSSKQPDPTMYYYSEGIDVSEEGQATLLPYGDGPASGITSGLRLEVCDGKLFATDGTTVRYTTSATLSSWTNDDPHDGEGAVAVQDLAARGDELFAALGANGVHIRASAGTWSHWQPDGAIDLDVGTATRIAYLRDRIFVIGGTDSRSIYEVVNDSTPTSMRDLPEGWVYSDIWEAGEYIYASAYSFDSGLTQVMHFGLNSGGTAVEWKGSSPFPRGQLLYCGVGYLGKVFVGGGKRNSENGYSGIVYQCAVDGSGFLYIESKVIETEGAGPGNFSVRKIEPVGESVLFGIAQGSTHPYATHEGLVRYDLAEGSLVYDLGSDGHWNILTAQESSVEDGTYNPFTSDVVIAASSTAAQNGTQSVRLTSAGTNNAPLRLSDITVAPSTAYTFSWYGQGSVERTGGSSVIREYNANGTLLATSTVATSGDPLYTVAGMTRKWNTFTTGASTSFIEIEMRIASSTAGEFFYFDAFQLELGSSANGFQLGRASTTPTDIVRFGGKTVFAVPAGIRFGRTDVSSDPGTIITSMADWSNKGEKVWDYIEIEHPPLVSGSSIAVYYTTDDVRRAVWTLAGTAVWTLAEPEGTRFTLTGVTGRTLALKFVLTDGGSGAPSLKGFSVRSNPKPSTPEWVLTRYVDLTLGLRKKGQGWNKNPLTVRRQLQDMLYENVTFYDEEGTWTGRLQQIQDVEPEGQPDAPDTGGKSDENSYVMALTIQATRDA